MHCAAAHTQTGFLSNLPGLNAGNPTAQPRELRDQAVLEKIAAFPREVDHLLNQIVTLLEERALVLLRSIHRLIIASESIKSDDKRAYEVETCLFICLLALDLGTLDAPQPILNAAALDAAYSDGNRLWRLCLVDPLAVIIGTIAGVKRMPENGMPEVQLCAGDICRAPASRFRASALRRRWYR